ncbi:microfibril-associated glycoprotein 4-like [Mya arenaria]|uniref:microfibril-associated glycoprotein 4-like n=1 Tax=Mya arenaria TaxID=6604 RepID=UPI0022DF36DE|nr:microfibril-associated glycoprotein 4-like [Mya arenaria]
MLLLLSLLAVGSLGSIKCILLGDETALNVGDVVQYKDCDDILKSGKYQKPGAYLVYPNSSEPITVYCDFGLNIVTHVIMQQKYGLVSFNKSYKDYDSGFGNVSEGDFWIGLQNMTKYTNAGYNVLTLTMQDWSNQTKVVRYNNFRLGTAAEGYRLTIGGYHSANSDLPDNLYHNNGARFATPDKPDTQNCATNQGGGWWYNYCTFTLPTGHYYSGGSYTPPASYYNGIYYKDWHGFAYSLKYIKMELSTA